MKINQLRISIVLLFVAPGILFAQNNLPVDMKMVEGGFYGMQGYDSITNITKTRFSKEIDSFYMSATEVSIQDFKQFCSETNRNMPPPPDWGWKDPKLPVVNVTYTDAMEYCNWLTEKYGILFTLPTPEQWEYAARADNFDTTDFIYSKELPNQYVVYRANSKDKPNCITCMLPNEIGLYAMCGNVWEWTLIENKKQGEAPVIGGSFFEDSDHVGVNIRKNLHQDLRSQDVGFRIITEAKAFKHYLFVIKVKELLQRILSGQTQITITMEGIHKGNLFIDWNNAAKGFIYNEEKGKAKFCCSSGKKPLGKITFTFDLRKLELVEEFERHIKSYIKTFL